MPIHPLKMLYRGFNQSLIIAQLLSSKLAKTEVKNIGNRKKFGKPQRFRTREQRLKIVPANFIIYQQEEIQGRSLALVDDVVTTGSTANAITKSLLNAGAKSVDLWCIAKTSWHNGSGSIKI
jgi:ComF family protein